MRTYLSLLPRDCRVLSWPTDIESSEPRMKVLFRPENAETYWGIGCLTNFKNPIHLKGTLFKKQLIDIYFNGSVRP